MLSAVNDAARAFLAGFLPMLGLGLTLLAGGCREQPDPSATPDPPPAPPATGAAPAGALSPGAKPQAELSKLPGKWLRADGGYVLEIDSVDGAGKMVARYFNPRPIRITRAEGRVESSVAKIFVELNDEGYPGCTYSLAHDQRNDLLVGVYYQAAMQQSFEVVFERAK